MAEVVFTGSSEVSTAANHTCSSEDIHDGSDVQGTNHALTGNAFCNNKTVAATVTSEETPQAPVESTEPVDAAVLQTSSTAAVANDADEDVQTATDDVNGTDNDCRHSDMEQASVNGNGSVQQYDEGKNLDASSSMADDGLELSVNRAKQKFGAFHQLDHPASVVIDLRSPPLVQVCLLHGSDDVGAGGSGSSGSAGVRRRPQTARRGRRWHSGMTYHTTDATTSHVDRASSSHQPDDKNVLTSATDVSSSQLVAGDDKKSDRKDENSTAELSTIIHLKVVDTSHEKVTSGQLRSSSVADNSVRDSQLRLRQSDADHNSESSDDSTMQVRNVNRTYSRNPSVPAARKNPQLITIAKSADYHDSKKRSQASFDYSTRTTSQHAQEFKSVPKKSKKTVKQRTRIGPAWFSRKSLNAPPPEIWECARTSKALKMLKRPNYKAGVRCLPIVARPPTVKQVLQVPGVEEADIATVGREQLKLWRLSEDDVSELQLQLRQEAEHRRTEHIMPLVMQMTDAQIEHAYEHVAESMKTYEIVEADSDEDLEEDEESEEDIADDYENSGRLESADWNISEEIGAKGFGETEYSRSRPKRHAVDYGPSAFTPIMIMEGRRLFSQRKSSRASMVKSADVADGVELQQRSHGHKSHRRKRKKGKLTEETVESPVGKHTDDTEDTSGCYCCFLQSGSPICNQIK